MVEEMAKGRVVLALEGAITGWKASECLGAFRLKLMVRGSMPCLIAACAAIVTDEVVGQDVRPELACGRVLVSCSARCPFVAFV